MGEWFIKLRVRVRVVLCYVRVRAKIDPVVQSVVWVRVRVALC